MDEFYNDLYGDLIFSWIKSLCKQHQLPDFDYIENKTYKKAIICQNDLNGTVTYWIQDNIIEEEIRDQGDHSLFYLHYNIISLKQCYYFVKDFINSFINFLKLSNIHVLLCCSGGLSSTLFSDHLQSIANDYHYPITFKAVGVNKVKDVIDDYDMILLAPQVAYMQPDILQMCHHQQEVICISANDFATQNYHQLFFEIANRNLSKKVL